MGMPSGGLEISLQLLFSNEQRENLDIMNALVNSLYDQNYAGIVKTEENEEDDEENTDDEYFARTSSNNNKCEDVILLY